nr:translation initiation factor IF-2-like [Pongo pygmaeus]
MPRSAREKMSEGEDPAGQRQQPSPKKPRDLGSGGRERKENAPRPPRAAGTPPRRPRDPRRWRPPHPTLPASPALSQPLGPYAKAPVTGAQPRATPEAPKRQRRQRPRRGTGKTAGISVTRFWLRLRGTNLPSFGPPRFGDKHNSARSSPGFRAGEEAEKQAAALQSPRRPHLPCGPHPRPCSSTPASASPQLPAEFSLRWSPAPTHRVRQSQEPEIRRPSQRPASAPWGPGLSGTYRARETPAGSPALARAPAPRLLQRPARGERRPGCPSALRVQFLEGPQEGRGRGGAGVGPSELSGPRLNWNLECAAVSGGPSTLAAPLGNSPPPPAVAAAGGDDVLHFVGTTVGTWDPSKPNAVGLGLVPGSPDWALPFGQGNSPSCRRLRPRGSTGRARRWRHPDTAPRLHQPRWRELGSRRLEGRRPALGRPWAPPSCASSPGRWHCPGLSTACHRLLVRNG